MSKFSDNDDFAQINGSYDDDVEISEQEKKPVEQSVIAALQDRLNMENNNRNKIKMVPGSRPGYNKDDTDIIEPVTADSNASPSRSKSRGKSRTRSTAETPADGMPGIKRSLSIINRVKQQSNQLKNRLKKQKLDNLNSGRYKEKSDDNTEFAASPSQKSSEEEAIEALTKGLTLEKIEEKNISYASNMPDLNKIRKGNRQAAIGLSQEMIKHFISCRQNGTNLDLTFLSQMLEAGANINCCDAYGQSLMHEVIRFWHHDVFSFFIQKDAEYLVEDSYDVTLFHVAAAAGRDTILLELFDLIKIKIMNLKTDEEKKELSSYLLTKTRESGQTMLHYAAKFDQPKCIKIIIEELPELKETKDKLMRTPLILAAELDRTESAKTLLEENCNPSEKDSMGQSCMSSMIEKMPSVACQALDHFQQTYRSKRIQLFHIYKLLPDVQDAISLLDEKTQAEIRSDMEKNDRAKITSANNNRIEPIHQIEGGQGHNNDAASLRSSSSASFFSMMGSEFSDIKKAISGASSRASGLEYPMDVAVENMALNVLSHDVMHRLIDIKWDRFGRKGAMRALIMNIILVVAWSTVSIINKSYPYMYCLHQPTDIVRVVIWPLAFLYNAWFLFMEINEFLKSRAAGVKKREFKEKWLDRRIKMEHPRWPDNKKFYEQEKDGLGEDSALRLGLFLFLLKVKKKTL